MDPDPKADVIVVGLVESSVTLRARWWTKSAIADVLTGRDAVLAAVKRELLANGIDIPYPTRMILFDDQAGEADGGHPPSREVRPAERGP